MILADTNIMIDYFNSRESALAKKIDTMPIALCGVVRTEILHGAKDEEINDYIRAFSTFDNLITDDYDWDGTGLLLQTLRTNGLQVPLADAFIAFTAMKYDIPLWTRDNHFKYIMSYYPELKIYEE